MRKGFANELVQLGQGMLYPEFRSQTTLLSDYLQLQHLCHRLQWSICYWLSVLVDKRAVECVTCFYLLLGPIH